MRFLVTGASGFIGRPLCMALAEAGHTVRAATRGTPLEAFETVVTGEIDGNTDWRGALAGIDVIVHLAARVHVMQEHAIDPLAAYMAANAEGTRTLAEQAAQAGVRRFVLVSSVKVNGEATAPGQAWREDDAPAPLDPYGVSKLHAEQSLRDVAARTGMEAVIVRPPLVYGPGVGANFARLMRLVDKGYPLPFGAIRNRRSMVYVGNLVDALMTCALHPAAANETFFVADEPPLSTGELVVALASAQGKPNRLFTLPTCILAAAGRLTGQREAIRRLTESLVISSDKIRTTLDWQPPYSMNAGLVATADARTERRSSPGSRA